MTADDEPDAVLITHPTPAITVITLNRPARRNAVNAATARKLYSAILTFEANSAAKIGILHGNNGTFCAGYDLHTIGQSNDIEPPSPNETENARSQGPMGPIRLRVKKPLIAAVSGYAVAGGLELSLLADMRIVEEDAIFGVFCRRWGVPLIDGGTIRLPAIVGLGRAMDMIITGRPVGADEALAMGLANRVVPARKALEEAMKIAEDLVRFPQVCLNADRASAYFACYDARSWDEAVRFEYDGGRKAMAEARDGAKRFAKGAGRSGSFAKL